MKNFLDQAYANSITNTCRIVFSEGEDDRVLDAVSVLISETEITPILIGEPDIIIEGLKSRKIEIDAVEVVDPQNSKYSEAVLREYQELVTVSEDNPNNRKSYSVRTSHYFGTIMVRIDLADGMVTGAKHSTGESIRPALQFIPKKEKFQKISGAFFMQLEDKTLLFADTAVTIEPEVMDLVDIAEDTVETAKQFGIEPRVAFLSFSTKNSSDNLTTDKMERAAKIFKDKHPEIPSDGELQADTALVPDVAKRKAPESEIRGDATILIFPDLNSANIAYKLVERLAKTRAIGPILQGLTKPINDLSRGCTAQDIADIAVITAVEALQSKV